MFIEGGFLLVSVVLSFHAKRIRFWMCAIVGWGRTNVQNFLILTNYGSCSCTAFIDYRDDDRESEKWSDWRVSWMFQMGRFWPSDVSDVGTNSIIWIIYLSGRCCAFYWWDWFFLRISSFGHFLQSVIFYTVTKNFRIFSGFSKIFIPLTDFHKNTIFLFQIHKKCPNHSKKFLFPPNNW